MDILLSGVFNPSTSKWAPVESVAKGTRWPLAFIAVAAALARSFARLKGVDGT